MGLPLSLINLYSNLNLALKAQQNLVTAKKVHIIQLLDIYIPIFIHFPPKA
jgi:hypothetical protein